MKLKALTLLAPLLLCGSPLLAQFEHPDLKSGRKQVRTILMLPVQVEITKVGMHGGEPMIQESLEVQKSLAPVIANVLQKQGYTVDQDKVAPAVLENDPDLRYTVDDLQKKFDNVLGQMTRKSKDVRKARFTLGDDVARLAAGENFDALLFVRAAGEVKTGGKKAFGWLVTGDIFDYVMMRIGVVDSRSGDILYFAKPTMLKNLAKDTAETAGGVQKAFRNFVKANASSTASKAKEPAVAQPQGAEPATAESETNPTEPAKAENNSEHKPKPAPVATASPSKAETAPAEDGAAPATPPDTRPTSTSGPPK